MTEPDVLIVGAGVAGLAAGRELVRQGRCPLILEARDRVGGRILTVHDPLSPLPVELGAEMVHGLHPVLWQTLEACAATVVEMRGDHLRRSSQGLHHARYFEQVDRVFERMKNAPEQSFASFLAKVRAPGEVKQAATGFVEGFNAARKEDVSVAWLNQENEASAEIDGERNFRVVSGYGGVPLHLSRGLDVRLSTRVKRVRWKKGEVVAETDAGSFRAAKCVVAVPFSLLRTGDVAIEPDPPALRAAHEAIATGDAIRITFRFRKMAWEKYPHLSFLHGDAAFPVWWTSYPVRAPLITAWAAGPKADALSGLGREELVRVALESLETILGEPVESPQAAHLHDWRGDALTRGAYSYLRVNGAAAQRALSKPLRGTLCLAGEAVGGPEHMGTVHGAMASGIRAARLL